MTKKFRGQTAVLEIEDEDDDLIGIGTLDDPFVGVPQEVAEGRGTGSTEWFDIQQTEQAVTMGGDIMTMDIDAWDRMIGWDEEEGELDDSADVVTFTGRMTYTAADGSTKEIVAGPGYRDSDLELGGSRDEWVGMSVELRCQTIQDIINTDEAE